MFEICIKKKKNVLSAKDRKRYQDILKLTYNTILFSIFSNIKRRYYNVQLNFGWLSVKLTDTVT